MSSCPAKSLCSGPTHRVMIGDVRLLDVLAVGVDRIGESTYVPAGGLMVCLEAGDVTDSPLRRAVEIDTSLKDLFVF